MQKVDSFDLVEAVEQTVGSVDSVEVVEGEDLMKTKLVRWESLEAVGAGLQWLEVRNVHEKYLVAAVSAMMVVDYGLEVGEEEQQRACVHRGMEVERQTLASIRAHRPLVFSEAGEEGVAQDWPHSKKLVVELVAWVLVCGHICRHLQSEEGL